MLEPAQWWKPNLASDQRAYTAPWGSMLHLNTPSQRHKAHEDNREPLNVALCSEGVGKIPTRVKRFAISSSSISSFPLSYNRFLLKIYTYTAAMKSTTLVASLGLLGTTLAQSTTYACNPAHSYPNGATCVSTAGSLALVTPSVSASSSANVWPCNPAHKFPPGQSCVSSGSGYHLQQQTKSASKASASHTAGGVVYTTEVVTALTT